MVKFPLESFYLHCPSVSDTPPLYGSWLRVAGTSDSRDQGNHSAVFLMMIIPQSP